MHVAHMSSNWQQVNMLDVPDVLEPGTHVERIFHPKTPASSESNVNCDRRAESRELDGGM